MIHNRTINRADNQVDLTDNDLLILLYLKTPVEPRKYDRQDAAIMRARTLAHNRGATATEIEND
jgi:hypothetical protein